MLAERRPANPERPATARLFFALWPTPVIADSLGETARQAAARFGGRPTRPETIHLTLAFLGDQPTSSLPGLVAAAASVRAAAFDLTMSHTGFWPRQRLIWAGVADSPPLSSLHAGLGEALAAAGYRLASEPRPFRPHLTLVRRIRADGESASAADVPSIAPIAWPCRRFVLVQSTPGPSGSAYRVIEEFPLAD